MFQVCKFGVLRQPSEIDGSNWTVTLLSDNDLGNSLEFGILVVVIVTIDEHYHIGILLDGSGLSEVGKHRTVIRSLLYGSG